MKTPLLLSLMAALLPQISQACAVNSNSGFAGSVIEGNVYNPSGALVGYVNGEMVNDKAGTYLGGLVINMVVRSGVGNVGSINNPSVSNSSFQTVGYGADCTDSELAAALLLLF